MRAAFFPLSTVVGTESQDSQETKISLSRSHSVPAHSADRLLSIGIGKFDEASE